MHKASSGPSISSPSNPSLAKLMSSYRQVKQLVLRKMTPQMALSGVVAVILMVGVVASVMLTQVNQDVRQQAWNADLYDNIACTQNSDCGEGGVCITSPYGRFCKEQGTEEGQANEGGCGNGICYGLETLTSCPQDCKPTPTSDETECSQLNQTICIDDIRYTCSASRFWNASGTCANNTIPIGQGCLSSSECAEGLTCSNGVCKEVVNPAEGDTYTQCRLTADYQTKKDSCADNEAWSEAICNCISFTDPEIINVDPEDLILDPTTITPTTPHYCIGVSNNSCQITPVVGGCTVNQTAYNINITQAMREDLIQNCEETKLLGYCSSNTNPCTITNTTKTSCEIALQGSFHATRSLAELSCQTTSNLPVDNSKQPGFCRSFNEGTQVCGVTPTTREQCQLIRGGVFYLSETDANNSCPAIVNNPSVFFCSIPNYQTNTCFNTRIESAENCRDQGGKFSVSTAESAESQCITSILNARAAEAAARQTTTTVIPPVNNVVVTQPTTTTTNQTNTSPVIKNDLPEKTIPTTVTIDSTPTQIAQGGTGVTTNNTTGNTNVPTDPSQYEVVVNPTPANTAEETPPTSTNPFCNVSWINAWLQSAGGCVGVTVTVESQAEALANDPTPNQPTILDIILNPVQTAVQSAVNFIASIFQPPTVTDTPLGESGLLESTNSETTIEPETFTAPNAAISEGVYDMTAAPFNAEEAAIHLETNTNLVNTLNQASTNNLGQPCTTIINLASLGSTQISGDTCIISGPHDTGVEYGVIDYDDGELNMARGNTTFSSCQTSERDSNDNPVMRICSQGNADDCQKSSDGYSCAP